MRVNNSSVIHLTTLYNPHRYGVNNWHRWNLLREGMTVGEFLTVADSTENNRRGNVTGRAYIQHALERSIISIPDAIATMTRAPRTMTAMSPLSADLGQFTFGVEIECILPSGLGHTNAAARVTTETGIECRSELYGHTVSNAWKVITDGSLGVSYDRGAEFVSPPLRGEEGLRQVEKVCLAIRALGAKITKRCGFHVHVGIGYAPVEAFKRMIQLYANNEPLLDTIQPESRQMNNNNWCRSLLTEEYRYATRCYETILSQIEAATTREDVIRILSGDHARGSKRYKKLNLASWWAYRTVEFRHHAGTVEADKASYWVKFCLRMVALAMSSTPLPVVTTLNELMTAVGCSADEQAFYLNRAARLAAPTRRAA